MKGVSDPLVAERIKETDVHRLFKFLTREYDYIIIDTQTVINGTLLDVLRLSDVILLVSEPSLESFLRSAHEFAVKTGLATKRVVRLMDAAEEAGAVGAAQNMLGEAVHALVERDKVKNVVEVFERVLPRDKIVVAEVSLQGAQLVT